MHRVTIAVVLAVAVCAASPASAAALRVPRTCPASPGFSAADFGRPVDNPYFPLTPGETLFYRGHTEGEATSDIFSVTRATKVIEGVTTTVIHDRGFVKGRLEEDTLDWYAQDRAGNVWYFGEDTKQLENGRVVGHEGSWEAGRNGAQPGIFMPAHPAVGQSLQQENAPGVAEDCFQVASLRATVRNPFRSSRHAMRTDEFSPLEPGVLDYKYYVRGIGTVREVSVKPGGEDLVLVAVRRR